MQMDLTRHSAAGTLAELLGDMSPSLIDSDIQMRAHHFTQTCTAGVADAVVVDRSAGHDDGEDAHQLLRGRERVHRRSAVAEVHAAAGAGVPVRPGDDQAVDRGRLAARRAAPGVRALVRRRQRHLPLAARRRRPSCSSTSRPMPALAARKGIGDDFDILAPVDPTYTLPSGWTGMSGDTSRASRRHPSNPSLLALYDSARRAVRRHGPRPPDQSVRRQQQLDRRAAAVGDGPRARGQRHALVAAEPAHLLSRAPGGARQARHDGRAVPRAAGRHPRHERARRLGLDGEQHRHHRRVSTRPS